MSVGVLFVLCFVETRLPQLLVTSVGDISMCLFPLLLRVWISLLDLLFLRFSCRLPGGEMNDCSFRDSRSVCGGKDEAACDSGCLLDADD